MHETDPSTSRSRKKVIAGLAAGTVTAAGVTVGTINALHRRGRAQEQRRQTEPVPHELELRTKLFDYQRDRKGKIEVDADSIGKPNAATWLTAIIYCNSQSSGEMAIDWQNILHESGLTGATVAAKLDQLIKYRFIVLTTLLTDDTVLAFMPTDDVALAINSCPVLEQAIGDRSAELMERSSAYDDDSNGNS